MDLGTKVYLFRQKADRQTENCNTEMSDPQQGLIALSRFYRPEALGLKELEEAKAAFRARYPVPPIEIITGRAGEGYTVMMTVSCYSEGIDPKDFELLLFEWSGILDEAETTLRGWDKHHANGERISRIKKAQ